MRTPFSKKLIGAFVCLVAVTVSVTEASAQEDFVQAITEQQLIQSGQALFIRHCSGCHGIDAQGAGPASSMLWPKPRNLVAGSFKFRSTPSGTLPVADDLIRTIDQGVLGTSMPSFRLLSPSEKLALATFIKSLRSDWKQSQGTPIALPGPPSEIFDKKDTLLASAKRGRALFEVACMTCHGNGGQGDGPSAEGLMDAENRPIKPANLTKLMIKSGRSARDVFKAISTGLDGTPMPGFAEAFTEAQRWDLVAYVFALRGQGAGLYPNDPTLSSIAAAAPKKGGH